jgi:hypothetical protein
MVQVWHLVNLNFNVVTINDSGLRAASLGIYGGLSNGF